MANVRLSPGFRKSLDTTCCLSAWAQHSAGAFSAQQASALPAFALAAQQSLPPAIGVVPPPLHAASASAANDTANVFMAVSLYQKIPSGEFTRCRRGGRYVEAGEWPRHPGVAADQPHGTGHTRSVIVI